MQAMSSDLTAGLVASGTNYGSTSESILPASGSVVHAVVYEGPSALVNLSTAPPPTSAPPTSIRMTPDAFEFTVGAVREASDTGVDEASVYRSVPYADIVAVRHALDDAPSGSDPIAPQPAVFGVWWSSPKPATSSCCGANPSSDRVMGHAVFHFTRTELEGSTSPASRVDPFVSSARFCRQLLGKVSLSTMVSTEPAPGAGAGASGAGASSAGSTSVIVDGVDEGTDAVSGASKDSTAADDHVVSKEEDAPVVVADTDVVVQGDFFLPIPKRRLVVYLNPVGGTGKARQIYDQTTGPLFAHAQIDVDLIVTTHQYHAADEVRRLNMSTVDGIVTVGGDGLLNEVVSGVMSRPDWRQALQTPFGIIPAGSGNGLAAALLHTSGDPYAAAHSAFRIARGNVIRLDLSTLTTPTQRYFQFLSLTWCIIADIDIESENMRCCGPLRFDVAGAVRGMCLRKYRGTMSYLPDDQELTPTTSEAARNPTSAAGSAAVELADELHSEAEKLAPGAPDTDGPASGVLESKAKEDADGIATTETNAKSDSTGPQLDAPGLNAPIPANWKVVDGVFTFFLAQQVSHISSAHHTEPEAELSDGFLHVAYAQDIGCCSMVGVLLAMEDPGVTKKSKHIQTFKTRALRVEPDGDNGILSLDGEALPVSPFQIEVHQGMMNVFA